MIDNMVFGGGERAFLQIASGLDRSEFEPVFVCTPSQPLKGMLQAVNIPLLPVDFSKQISLSLFRELAAVLAKEQPAIVHTQGSRADFYGRLSTAYARKARLVSTVAMPVEGFDVPYTKRMFYLLLDRFTERFVDIFVVVSEELKRTLAKKHGIPTKNILNIHNGIETESYRFDPAGARTLRQELCISEDTVLVGSVGRLVWQKGFSYFIEAASIVSEKFPDARFVLIGDGEKKEELQQLASLVDMEEKVFFAGFRSNVQQALSAFDIAVISSVHEGSPIVLLEAMATGRPTVATALPGIVEVAQHDKEAILVPPADPAQLAQGIITLLQNRKKAALLGNTARRTVESNFDIRVAVKAHEKLYRDLLARKNIHR